MGRRGCRVAATGLLSALPRHSSCSIIPIPMPSSSPISIPGAAVGNISLVLVAKDALVLAPTPFSRLLQPSVRGVVDLEVMTFGRHPLPYPSLCGRVTLSVGVHSVCAPVSKSGGLAGLLRSPGSVHSSDGSSASRPFLRFLLRDSVYQFQALCFGLSTAPPVFNLGHGSCFSFTPFSGYPYASIPRHLAGPVFLSGVSPRGSSTCPPALSSFWDCHPSQVFQPRTFPGSAVSVGRLRFHLFQGFSVGGTHLSAAICNRRIYVMRLDYRGLWLLLLGVLSSLAHLVPGG